MKKTLIALMALAGVACAADYTMNKEGDLFAGAFTLTFDVEDLANITGDYDILAAYYQTTGRDYAANVITLNSNGTLWISRVNNITFVDGAITSEATRSDVRDKSIFKAGDSDYVLTAGSYTLKYLGGTNGSAAADLYLGDVKVASFTGGAHNMNGAEGGGNTLKLLTNDDYNVVATEYPGMPVPPSPSVPEPTTATLSLLALAGLAARRRRK